MYTCNMHFNGQSTLHHLGDHGSFRDVLDSGKWIAMVACNLKYVRHFYYTQKACPHGQNVHSHGQHVSLNHLFDHVQAFKVAGPTPPLFAYGWPRRRILNAPSYFLVGC